MMKHKFRLLVFAFLLPACLLAQKPTRSSDKAIVKSGEDVRFTVLTDGVIRMEWDSTGLFTDDPSFVVVRRDLPVPVYNVSKSGGWLTISTPKMIVRYKTGSGKFTARNLSVKSSKNLVSHTSGKSAETFSPFEWKPGMKQAANLKGTYRTLDGCNGDTHIWGGDSTRLNLEDGILAKDGWSLIDDSGSFLFDGSDWSWVKKRTNPKAQDWYFMAYGRNYKSALRDYSLIAGYVPMPPKFAFGYWWSRYWSYSDKEIRELVGNFKSFGIPLDVLVVDMDWHITRLPGWKDVDEFGEYPGWTGWTWNEGLFPDHKQFLKWTDAQPLKTTLNLHPASGMLSHEEKYQAFAEKMGVDPATKKGIPWVGSDKQFVTNLFDVVLHPMQQEGVDFWWIDWQQYPYDKKVQGLSNTWWVNYLFFSDMERNGSHRPLLYHRWGGLGNHRYQIGFSGDTFVSWKSLEYQPYFTNTASNVLYGYWSHDIGGHMSGSRYFDPELYTRWLQYGAFSPIIRTHSTKSGDLKKEIWNFRDDFFKAQKEAIRLRYNLVPYIYTMARECHETGISLCRPLYYDYPEKVEAYSFSREYLFGDDMLVAPIGEPMKYGVSNVSVWLPEGNDWFEWQTGTMLKGGQTVERSFAITEYPVYVKAGSIIPMYDDSIMNLQTEPDRIRLGIFPGGEGKGRLYEDNDDDKNYETEYAYTNFRTNCPDANTLKIDISPREGTYAGMPKTKLFQLYLYGRPMPESVTLDGKPVRFSYIGSKLCVQIDLPETNCNEAKQVEVRFKPGCPELNDGLLKKFNEVTNAVTALKYKNAGVILPLYVGKTEETSLELEYFPERFNELVDYFRKTYPEVVNYLGSKK
ncbi:MAG: glycoside hydrolase family 31 protein [Bacteroidota bacterium]|nr:glycoside hydrolase family 31 protein [Bacteroidota bacterium]